jgi:hypothetical protein
MALPAEFGGQQGWQAHDKPEQYFRQYFNFQQLSG